MAALSSQFDQPLAWIDAQRDRMIGWVRQWSAINSHTGNLEGLAKMTAAIEKAMTPLGGDVRRIDLPGYERVDPAGRAATVPVGQALSIRKRPEAERRVLLCIHMDTVYPPQSQTQPAAAPQSDRLLGPGVADAKGGIAVLLVALEAFERSSAAERLGWEIVLNPDEEIGSPSSVALLHDAAQRNHLGLVFEPSLADSSFAGARKGSGSFTFIIRGKSAHVGREFHAGRSAIFAAAQLVHAIESLNKTDGVIANVGQVEGGGPVNVVPDLAVVRANVRVSTPQQMKLAESELARIGAAVQSARPGITVELHGRFLSPPKVIDPPMQRLMDNITQCGQALGQPVRWQETGGVCDGNKLAAAGLPNIDTLGVRGGEIHSPREYLVLDSLTERAKLTALLLMKLASGELPWPKP